MKKILITGITGQDGIFLTNLLLKENNFIYGISRGKNLNSFNKKLNSIGRDNFENLKIINLDLLNYTNVNNLLNDIKPDYIYNLTGPSSVYESIRRPEIAFEIENIFDNLISSLQKNNNLCKFFQASSSEMFEENNNSTGLDENSKFNPRNPYSKAKLNNHKKVLKLNKQFGWEIKSGILFNHESEFRNSDFLIPKLVNAAKNIKKGEIKRLEIGSLKYERDWSFAGDVAEAIKLITENNISSNYVVGRGKSNSIKELIEIIFNYHKLNWEEFVVINPQILRNDDPEKIFSKPAKIKNDLGWQTKKSFEDLIIRCIEKINY